MSFSSDLKEELSKISNLNKKNEVKYELIGYLISRNTSLIKNNVRFATESDYNINRFSKLLKNLNINYKIDFDGKSFIIILKVKDLVEEVKIENSNIIYFINNIINDNEKRALIRGVFLGGGSLNNPDKTYHLEVNLSSDKNLNVIYKLLKEMNIKCKELNQNDKYSIYIKDGEDVFNFIALIGANNSALKFEDIRIKREMRGKVNRIVNCKTANLNKTINASVEQIEAIRKIQNSKKFNELDDNLKEIAELRLKHPDISLIDLGKKLKEPLGKSGVNYRLKKIIKIAEEL